MLDTQTRLPLSNYSDLYNIIIPKNDMWRRMLVLNTAVAEALTSFKARVDALIEKGEEKTNAILTILREDIKTCKPIHFEGNGYSEEWKQEAKHRGLDCETNCPVIYDRYLDEDSIKMFEDMAAGDFAHSGCRIIVVLLFWSRHTSRGIAQ